VKENSLPLGIDIGATRVRVVAARIALNGPRVNGVAVREACVYLTPEEARDLLAALAVWADEVPADPEWHTHVDDEDRELVIAINPDSGRGQFSDRS